MKVKELMVGDWFLLNGKPMKVSSIKHLNDIRILEESGEKIEPAPITTEILEKNGFCAGQHSDFLSGISDDCRVEYLIYHGFTIKSKNVRLDIKCEHVHELQHALRLAKIDKEIKL